VILSGPSCVGKSPLLAALRRFYPALAARLQSLVLYNDRLPRPGEENGVSYYFRPHHYIEDLDGKPGYVVLPVRRDLQALEIAQVLHALDQRKSPLFEGNAYIAETLMAAPELIHIPRVSVFLSPLSLEEILNLRLQPDLDLETVIHEIMREKLTRRATRQKGVLSEQDLLDIEARSASAYRELQYAPHFDWIIPNHDGEDSDNWTTAGYPLGDARRSLLDFVAILQGSPPRWAQKWPGELFDR
jgi:guanylate kinase